MRPCHLLRTEDAGGIPNADRAGTVLAESIALQRRGTGEVTEDAGGAVGATAVLQVDARRVTEEGPVTACAIVHESLPGQQGGEAGAVADEAAEVAEPQSSGPPPPVVGNEDETKMMVEEFDTEERERARERELERRRRGSDPDDPATDDPDDMSDSLL